MIGKQLKELPSVSQVMLEINDNISLHIRYIKYIINSEIKLYRKLAKSNSNFLLVPSAFTEITGKSHFKTLLKARAIENFSYIFAPAQAGKHYNGRKTFGHSLIVSPDGKILKSLNKKEGVITVSIDPSLPKKLRSIIPSLKKD